MNLFLIIGILGLVLFLFSMFGIGGEHEAGHDFGGDLDHGDLGHGGEVGHDGSSESISDSAPLFSYRTIVTFMAVFGAAGAIAHYYGLGMLLSSLIGVVAGILAGLFAWWLINLAFKQQASSLVTKNDLIGQTALVNTPIVGDDLGEISVEVKGQRQCYHAKSRGGNIAENAIVKIVESRGVFLVVEPVNQTNQQ